MLEIISENFHTFYVLFIGEAPNTTSKLMLATPDMVVENLLKREQLELKAQRSEALQEKVCF